jgi:hypothetical protein
MITRAEPRAPSVQRAVLNLARSATAPLYWHEKDTPWPRDVTGGSCFALRFADLIVGVTAAHVYREMRAAQQSQPTLTVQIGTSLFSTNTLIDIDDDQDLATFGWQRIAGQPIDCREQWPPPPLEKLRGLVIAGFPTSLREVRADRSATFGAWGSLSAVDDFSHSRIRVSYDPARDLPVPGMQTPMPPLHANLSGCSGGLAMMMGMHNRRLRWYPVGAVIEGPRGTAEGSFEGLDVFTLVRLDCIQPDGRIVRRR